jgi:mRNA interferase MazF
MRVVKRAEVYLADLNPIQGSEQGGIRPVLIIQNDIGNRYSPTVIVAAITAKISKARLPTHVEIKKEDVGLIKNSVILLEQIRTIDKIRLEDKIGELDSSIMEIVDKCLGISIGLSSNN